MGANRELAERIIAALNRGDVEAAASLYAPDATYVDAAGTTRGPAAIADLYRGFRGAFPDVHRRIERAVEEGDWAAFEMTMTATHTGPLRLGGGTVPASGGRLDMRLVHIAEVRDGQCVYTRSYFDQLDVMRQLGLMPPVALAASAVVGQLWNRSGRRLQDWKSRARG